MKLAAGAFLSLLQVCLGQQAGNLKTEGSPTISVKQCTKSGGCTTRDQKLVLDANWRWIHTTEGYANCYTGNVWDTSICSDPETCAQSCAIEAVDDAQYERTYGVTPVPGGVRLGFVTGSNVGSRLFLMEDEENYMMFKLKNREFALDVDSSQVECGMNGAMYFVEMAQDGGKGLGNNAAGARYGTGYCDAQCPHDVKFIGGQANSKDWKPHPRDFSNTMGLGHYGACCAEMDIWEANNMATAYTPHPCHIDTPGQYMCEGTECGDNDSGERYDGVCDKDGCDINPFRNGNTTFYGKGADFAVDSSRMMTVVTQFLTTDGTDDGDLSEIRRFYIQDGHAVASPPIKILTGNPDSITDQMCEDIKELFENENDFKEKGGNKVMGESLDRGHVAAFSLWDDIDVHMMWLDSCYPEDKDCAEPGVHRGMCPGGDESSPQNVRRMHPKGYVTFANVAFGEIGTTQSVYPDAPGKTTATPTTMTMTTTPPVTATSTTTTMSTTGGATSTTTPSVAEWIPVDGGEGRACRGASPSDNSASYYTVFGGMADLGACQAKCTVTPGCQGIEFKSGRCEVWTRAGGIQASIPVRGFTCLRFAGEISTTSSTTVAAGWSPVDGAVNRACRGASADDNSPSYYTLLDGVPSVADCRARCEALAGCRGIEHKNSRCELWTRPEGIQASKAVTGFVCWRYDGSSSSLPPTSSTSSSVPSSSMPSTSTSSPTCSGSWKQCGGRNFNGPTCCESGYNCVVQNEWYSQCKPSAELELPQYARKRQRKQRFLGPSFMQSGTRTSRKFQSHHWQEL
mmetsp:Transcript_36480/g.81439  ORF Transcript_36480/g.81439 Transcript_36480/m.81439 type:complete len:797 (-) Transcript_36480:98-2488(-)